MEIRPLPVPSTIAQYREQVRGLLDGWNSGDAGAIDVVRSNHPRFTREDASWLPKPMTAEEIRAIRLEPREAEDALARWYSFQSWEKLAEWVEAVNVEGSPVRRFEAAVEAVINGDEAALDRLLREDPTLVRARASHSVEDGPLDSGATLVHYLAANGVEGYRQHSPKNAVAIARKLLDSGADPDALAWMYESMSTTISMLVSSTPPAEAGVQVPLVEVLLDYGASPNGAGTGAWISPVRTALVFGFVDAAQVLVRRGARIETLSISAGLGRLDDVTRMLPAATAEERQRALSLAAQLGHAEVVCVLLDAGEDPNRYNLAGDHAHSVPLHQAVCADRREVVRLLAERGARLDVRDTIWHSTPLGWAIYCKKPEIEKYLRSIGAPEH